ncbi:MAG: CehA/McbA family metallohydrolase [Bryobacterales bacterium]|nr:CehA/McbA family metallohydrolase [Bryobacterales bacterium]
MIRRSVTLGALLVLLLVAYRFGGSQSTPAPPDEDELRRYRAVSGLVRTLLGDPDLTINETDRADLNNASQSIEFATTFWGYASEQDLALLRVAKEISGNSVVRLTKALDRLPITERAALPLTAPMALTRHWPYRRGALLLRLTRPDLLDDEQPAFVRHTADLAVGATVAIDVPAAPLTYLLVTFQNVPEAGGQVAIRLRSAGKAMAAIYLNVTTPPGGELKVSLVNQDGTPAAAVAGVYAADHRLIVPDEAIHLDGDFYVPGRARAYREAHYWPGHTAGESQVFFVRGSFSLKVPAGNYRVIAGRGLEYLPVTRQVAIKPGATTSATIAIRRWIDMPARGWYSGDGHVHYGRRGKTENDTLLLWTQAEDVHVANIMRMGDASRTYFEQYAYGKSGRATEGNYALVPGQEDPRTNFLGHTLHMNLQAPVRAPDQYYLYDVIFDAVRKQGGLSGYAHVYQPAAFSFYVRRNMTMNIPAKRIDFLEISEFGDIDSRLFYEFLNLGFALTASAGSDVPWGNSIGTSRVYCYTGPRFDPDAWYAAVRAGRTFVTTGPMLELTVNGELPGSTIEARRGDTLRIRAKAESPIVRPQYLEVVEQGKALRRVEDANRDALEVEFTIPVEHSTWIAVRAQGAHTTPVYVTVNGAPFWRVDQARELVSRRMRQLDDIEEQIRRGVPIGQYGNWDNPELFKASADQLRDRIRTSRDYYRDLLRRATGESR